MLFDALQTKDLEENPENVALVVGIIEAIGAHAERLLWEITHVAPDYLEGLPAEGKATVRRIINAQTEAFRGAFHRTPDHYRKLLEELDAPGDTGEQARTLWLDTIRRAARIIAGEREAVEAQSFMRHRLNDAPFEVDVDAEVTSLFEDKGAK